MSKTARVGNSEMNRMILEGVRSSEGQPIGWPFGGSSPQGSRRAQLDSLMTEAPLRRRPQPLEDMAPVREEMAQRAEVQGRREELLAQQDADG
jgi:hypothetical protein